MLLQTLPEDLYKLGLKNQICIDFSAVVIGKMRVQHASLHMEWIVMDVRDMKMDAESVDVAFDKVVKGSDSWFHS